MHRFSIFVAVFSWVVLMNHPTVQGETVVVASKSYTIQPNGPRSGEAGKGFFNIEGRGNGKYASFGVLVFDLPRNIDGKTVRSLTLNLVQTTPKFAKAGAINLFLSSELDAKVALKFDLETLDGVGKQIESLQPLGSGDFKNPEQGKVQSFGLELSDAVRDQITKAGKLYLVLVPADATVAATYQGVDEKAKEKGPTLMLDLP